MYERILTPQDGSANAAAVLPFVGIVAKATGARVELLRVVEDLEQVLQSRIARVEEDVISAAEIVIDDWDEVRANRERNALSGLETLAAPLREAGVTVETNVVEGDPAPEIIEAASAVPGTLLAMSTHGRSGVARWVLGSVTDRVVHHARTSTLVVRGSNVQVEDGGASLTRVILPLDGSATSEAAIPHAEELAKALGVGITIVRAASLAAYATFSDEGAIAYPEVFSTQVRVAAAEYVEDAAEAIRRRGVADVDTRVPDDTPRDAILNEVGAQGDKLVVLGSHGRSGPSRWLLGSVADQVVRHSPGPVLVVRAAEEA